MRRLLGPVTAVLLALLLAAGMTLAASQGGRTVADAAPLRSAPPVPDTGAGSSQVVLSADALTHPAHELVRAQLQRHFDAINAGDYAAWAGTVVPQRSEALSEPDWAAAYDTTRDGTIRIDRIDDLEGSRVLVRVSFVSTQDLSDAPADVQAERICWRNSLPMSGEPPLIEQTGGGSSTPIPC